MFVSYVLRVRPDAAEQGLLSGEVEAVTTGTRMTVRTMGDLISFVLATAPKEADSARAASDQMQR
ncbi:MAG: hypothetical protein ACRDVP_01445 [Acidimicrobiales bacterium]